MKVVIANWYYTFRLSPIAMKYLAELSNQPIYPYYLDEYEDGRPAYFYRLADWDNPEHNIEYYCSVNPYDESKDLSDSFIADRSNSHLIKVVEELGGVLASREGEYPLKIVDIPDGVNYKIESDEFGNFEEIVEVHRRWR